MQINPRLMAEIEAEHLVQRGHFASRSGRHVSMRLDRERLLVDPGFSSHLGYVLAKEYFAQKVDTVVSPAGWGTILAQWVGYFLEPRAKVIVGDPVGDVVVISERLDDYVRGKRVLLVDNVAHTGVTMGRTVKAIEAMGGEMIGGCALINTSDLVVAGKPIYGLFNSMIEFHDPATCPMCAAGVPLDTSIL